jgi:hypothetical protein
MVDDGPKTLGEFRVIKGLVPLASLCYIVLNIVLGLTFPWVSTLLAFVRG